MQLLGVGRVRRKANAGLAGALKRLAGAHNALGKQVAGDSAKMFTRICDAAHGLRRCRVRRTNDIKSSESCGHPRRQLCVPLGG